MSAFSTRALSRRPYVALMLLIAIACAIAIAITMLGHGSSTSQPSAGSLVPGSGTSVVFRHHHPHSNAGYGLNA
jgi:hypothetical protein